MATTMHGTRVGVGYQATPELGLSLGIPYIWELSRREIESSDVDLSGISDLRLTLDWKPAPGNGLSIVAGLSIPTGEDDNQVLEDRLGLSLYEGFSTPSQTQLGSGTWDPLLGANWVSQPIKGFRFLGSTLARFPLGESSKGLQAGFSIEASAAASYELTEKLSLTGGLHFSHRESDQLDGQGILNTGGQILSVAVRAGWKLTESVTLSAGAHIPVYRNFHEAQLSPGVLFHGGVQIQF